MIRETVYREESRSKASFSSTLGNTGVIVHQETNNSRVFDAMRNHGLYMKTILESLFKRNSVDFADEIITTFLFYLELINIIKFRAVSKRFFYIFYTIETIDASLKYINSTPAIRKGHKLFTRFIQITPEIINKCPLYSYKGAIEVISSANKAIEAINKLSQESVLGFDTETRPAFKKGVRYSPSLIQLAGKDKVYIFQLYSMKLALFKKLFENENIIKAGVGIRDDINGLKQLGDFKASRFVEVSQLKSCRRIQNKGLRPLAAFLLELRISKQQQLSNWANRNLTNAQIEYAATDAWISRELYMKLK